MVGLFFLIYFFDEEKLPKIPINSLMYIRFQTSEIDLEWSTKLLGIFQFAYKLLHSWLPEYDDFRLNKILVWFDEHLHVPSKFSRKRTSSYTTRWISWYKDTAKEHLQNMYELKQIMEEHDIFVEVVMTDKPGYIVYEDEVQIVAEPYK